MVSAWGDQPHWYRNLLATPEVLVQQGSRAYSACAQVVTNSGEALRVLRLFRNRAPFVYDPLIARLSDREQVDERTLPDIAHTITIVRLDPQPGAPPVPPIRGKSRLDHASAGRAGHDRAAGGRSDARQRQPRRRTARNSFADAQPDIMDLFAHYSVEPAVL